MSIQEEKSPSIGKRQWNVSNSTEEERVSLLPGSHVTKQNSLVTIFCIWNTMMGTSLLSMPWAIYQAGFLMGIVTSIIMATMAFYTSYRVLKCVEIAKLNRESSFNTDFEFSDVCREYIGRIGEYSAFFFSLIAFLGALAVYWILISNFLFHIVNFIYVYTQHPPQVFKNSSETFGPGNVICPNALVKPPLHPNQTSFSCSTHFCASGNGNSTHAKFYSYWDEVYTVPFYLIILVFPLINFRSATFFSKFSALGGICVLYIIAFICIKISTWGMHMDFNNPDPTFNDQYFNIEFVREAGLMCLSYFIHNACVSITRHQKNPAHNTRDLGIAYILVCLTYTSVGVLFYLMYPLQKSCIQDNFLNNFTSDDIFSLIARVFLFFQMMTVIPNVFYIVRSQILIFFTGSSWPSVWHVLGLNVILVVYSILIARFVPHISFIIRYSGAICAMAYMFALPSVVSYVQEKEFGRVHPAKICLYLFLFVFGFTNLLVQFFF